MMSRTVTVETFANTLDAEVAKNLLESGGIHATVVADDAGGMLFPLTDNVRLMVLEENAGAAREILRSAGEKDAAEAELDQGEDDETEADEAEPDDEQPPKG